MEPPGARVYSGPVASRDPDRWAELRPRLRELIDRQRDGKLEVAAALAIQPSTLGRVLGGSSEGPGRQVIERAEAFLASREAKASDDARVSGPGGNGAAPPKPSGNGAPPAAGPLNIEQRERLAAYLALESGDVLRQAGVSREAAERAVAGGAGLDPKVVARLVGFPAWRRARALDLEFRVPRPHTLSAKRRRLRRAGAVSNPQS